MDPVPEAAARAVIRDLEGREHALSETWTGRAVVLAFVRHFGWMFCREQVAQLRHALPEIHGRGAELVVVGCGNRHFAGAFREDLELTTPLYVDTKREAYRALGMKRGILRTLNRGTFRNMWRSFRSGSRQKGIQGDPWQQGGILVVLPDGRVAYRYISDEAGDHPPVADVVAALPASRSAP